MTTTPARKRILVAEDEVDVLDLVAANLRSAGFQPVKTGDGASALREARQSPPALIVLDLMLPEMSGLEVCKALKMDAATRHIPIIMLTAKAEELDRIVGLELGADDYMTKPFSPRELVLRVNSVLRRASDPGPKAEALLEVGGIEVDLARCEVRVKGKPVELTATELKLLALLIERRGRVQSRDRLLNEVWGYESVIETRTVDTHIRRLRDKLGPAADCIETVRGFGYRVLV
ncbi:MAG: winged helix-turn-helix domain-containing protein [Verrucomicrobiota bacterium]|nr:winged helix-turn-helix domain-containing protein [Verrucomicrobiota bacterium]